MVIAIRADYYGRCAAYPELSSLLAANHVLVRPMQSDELRRAIELPAHRAGLRVEPELTDALVADTEDEPGALPLLSTALLELWQRRHGRRLRHADYERMGGVRGAVARLAEGAFERLDDAAADRRARRVHAARRRGSPRAPSSAGASRSPSSRPATRTPPRSSPCSPTSACSRSAPDPSRSPTRPSCASGRACAAGSRRTARACGSTAG